jgi:hypothetical protein
MQRLLPAVIVLCLIGTGVAAGEKSDAAALEQLPAGVKPVSIHILTRDEHFQHFYSVERKEVNNLTSPQSSDPHGQYRYWGVLGRGSSKPGDGLVKLNRIRMTVGKGKYATFYVEAPKRLKRGVKLDFFPVWVWEKPQPGLVPVYAVSGKDWRNIRLTTDRTIVKQAMEQAVKARKVGLKDHGIMFYIMPPPATKKGDEKPAGGNPFLEDEPDPESNGGK